MILRVATCLEISIGVKLRDGQQVYPPPVPCSSRGRRYIRGPDELLDGADLLLLAPRLDGHVSEAFLGAMGKSTPQRTDVPVIALSTAVEESLPEKEGGNQPPESYQRQKAAQRIGPMGAGPGLSAIRVAAAVFLWAGESGPCCSRLASGFVSLRPLAGLEPIVAPVFAVCVSPRQCSLWSPTIRFSCTALKPSVRVMVATSIAPPTPLVPVVHPWSVAVVLIRKIARSTQSCSGKNW